MKSEARNPKFETNSKNPNGRKFETDPPHGDSVSVLCASGFGFVSDFGFWISNFRAARLRVSAHEGRVERREL